MGLRVELHFVGANSPALEQVHFWHPVTQEHYLSVRGKTSGAYETDRTFQWTTAVQAVAILFVRTALHLTSNPSQQPSSTRPYLEGGKGSIVASLDYALDKQPAWLIDMFGLDSGGRVYLKKLLERSNPGLRRDGVTRIGLRTNDLPESAIVIHWGSEAVSDEQRLLLLLRNLEKSTGSVSSEEIIPQATLRTAEPESEVPHPPVPPPVVRRPSRNAAVFKTPIVTQRLLFGDGLVRCYEQDSQAALVISFTPYEELPRRERIPVRIHSSCTPSEAFGALDCDCKSQLNNSLEMLRRQHGVLIYLQQEGRGAGLFSKYQGMSISAQSGVDTYDAYRKMSLPADPRTYLLAKTILEDLGIRKIDLLTNNPSKVREMEQLGFEVTQQSCLGQVMPENLSYLYAKYTHGNHALRDVFFKKGDNLNRYLLRSPSNLSEFNRVWLFGGDDTLWEDNIIYEDIIRIFIDYICRHGAHPRELVRKTIDDIEREVIESLGYGAPGFLVSLRRAFDSIVQQSSTPIPPPTELFDSIPVRLGAIGREVSFRTIEVLRELRRRNDGLILFVQGPLEFQLRKIAQSRLGEFFNLIAIVPKKDTETLSWLLGNAGTPEQRLVVVGNNLETDITPATELGLSAVHYNNPNNWHLLNQVGRSQGSYREIHRIEEVLAL